MVDDTQIKDGVEFKGLKGTLPLNDALVLSGPFKVAVAPNAYSFTRANAVEIDWKKVLKKIGVEHLPSDSEQLRTYVERQWRVHGGDPDDAKIEDYGYDLDNDWPAYLPDMSTAHSAVLTPRDHPTVFTGNLGDYKLPPTAKETIEIVNGCVFRVPTKSGDRWYQPVIVSDEGKVSYPLTADFLGGAWKAKWDEVTALVQLFFPGDKPADPAAHQPLKDNTKKKAKNEFSAVENVRADAATIERQYQLLLNEQALAEGMSKKADEIASAIPNAQPAVIGSLVEQFRELKNFGLELTAKKRQLADAASDLNFHLFTAPRTITVYQDGTGVAQQLDLKEGDLYVKSNRTAYWITYQTRTRSSSGFFGIGASSRTYQVAVRNSMTFDFYEKAMVDYDPWVEILDFYKSAGFNVYLFRYTAKGLVAPDGSSVDTILRQCHEDEQFRLNCIVALPQKEVTLVGETFVVGYNLFIRPVPDVIVTSFPELSLRERLSYRFAWTGVALGELATTIPLSPGEQREVTLKTTERYNSSRSETATSLIDITRIDRADFETLFEREVRREHESTQSSSAGLSGSYAGISGSANFSQTSTTREVARQLNRSVQRAAQEVNRRTRDERTITVSETIETSRENATTFSVRNINEGSTLNIAFYRLYNAFESVLKLEDFEYIIRGGRSIFASTDLVDESVFVRGELGRIVDWLTLDGRFPYKLDDLTPEQKIAFACELYAQILKKYEEYPEHEPGEDGEGTAGKLARAQATCATLGASRRQQIEKLNEKFSELAAIALGDPAVIRAENFLDGFDTVMEESACVEEGMSDLPFWEERTDFAYDSGGLYADVYVGQRPATEKYSENMRRLEEGRIGRENRLIDARARYLEARAARQVAGLGSIIDPKKVYVTDRDTLLMDDGHVEMKLRLVPGFLGDRGWTLLVKSDGNFMGGSFLQEQARVDGVLVFKLPRRFSSGNDNILDRSHSWFKANVTAKNEDLGVQVVYKEP